MGLTRGKYSLFYRCNNYFFENRKPGDCVCTNYLTLRDQENIYAELEFLEEKGDLIPGVIRRTNSVKYEVTAVEDELVRVKIENLKASRRKNA